MTGRAIALCLSLLSLTAASALFAGENPPENQLGTPSSREAIQQKLQLVNILLTQSASLERASHSGDPSAKQMAEAVRTLYTNANNELNAGNTARAEASLDEALRLIENTSRVPPDPSQAEAKQQARYAELRNGLQALHSTYHDMRHRLFPKGAASPPVDAHLEDIQTLLDRVQKIAHDGRYREAIALLQNANAAAISALNKLLGSTSLIYDLQFQSPAEEFDYEMARYQSYEELIPISYSELKPSEDSIKLSQHYVHESHEMRDAAKQQAEQGDHQSALNTLLEAIKQVKIALRLVGLTLQD